jgi:hypothetical protein
MCHFIRKCYEKTLILFFPINFAPPRVLKPGKTVLRDHDEYVLGIKVFEAGPAQVIIFPSPAVLALGEDLSFNGLVEPSCLEFLYGLKLVQPPEEEEVFDLLNDLPAVGDPAGPEGIPNPVNLVP